ncbi:hypothetical protein Tco_0809316 [Tanacetum coccineum]
MASFKVLETQFQMFINSQIYLNDEYIVMTRNYFLQYTQLDILEFRETLVQFMEYVKKSIDERALHKMEYDSRVNERQTQTTEEKIDTRKLPLLKQPESNNEGEVTRFDSEPPKVQQEDIQNQCEIDKLLLLVQAEIQASVFMAMISDHNSSDLAPQRQEMFLENVSYRPRSSRDKKVQSRL